MLPENEQQPPQLTAHEKVRAMMKILVEELLPLESSGGF